MCCKSHSARRFAGAIGRSVGVIVVLLSMIMPTVASAADGVKWKTLNEPGSGGWIVSMAVSPHDANRVLIGGDMLGIGISTDRGATWQPTFGGACYEIGDFTWHPKNANVVWAGSMSGPMKSEDGGVNWQPKRVGFPAFRGNTYAAPVEKILFDPNDDNHLVTFGGNSRDWSAPADPDWGVVYESKDGGESWTRISCIQPSGSSNEPNAKGVNIFAMTFAGKSSSVLYASTPALGVLVTEDGGKTWAFRNAGLTHKGVMRLFAHPTDANTLWVSLGAGPKDASGDHLPGGVFKSTDAGRSWNAINTGLSQHRADAPQFTANYKGFAVSSKNPDHMVASDGSWNRASLYLTTDGGVSWHLGATRANIGHDDRNLDGVPTIDIAYFSGLGVTTHTFDPNDEKVIFGAGSEYAIRTIDGGKSWIDATSKRSGSGWVGRGYSGLCSVDFVFHPTQPGRAMHLAMDAGKLWETRDGYASWNFFGMKPSPWGGGNDGVYAGANGYVTFGQHGSFQGIARTKDDGKTWQTIAGPEHGLPNSDTGNEATGIYAAPANPDTVWTLVKGKLLVSTDAGEKWSPVEGAPTGERIAGDPTKPATFYIHGSNGISKTDDGKTFTSIGGPRPGGRGKIQVDSKGRVYACIWRGSDEMTGLWRYADGTWTRLLDERYTFDVAIDPKNPNRLAIATNEDPFRDEDLGAGIWISADDGKSWSKANDGLGMLRGQCIAFNPHDTEELVFGSFGRGYFVGRWPNGFAPVGTRTFTDTGRTAAILSEMDESVRTGNLLRNASVTLGNETPDDWRPLWTGTGTIAVARDTAVFKTGPASLRVESVGGSATGQGGQQLAIKGPAELNFRGVVKSTGKVKVNAAIQSFDKDWHPIGFSQAKYIQDDTDWESFNSAVAIPEGTENVNVLLLIEGDGKAWLDDAVVTSKATKPEPKPAVKSDEVVVKADAPAATILGKLKNGDMSGGEDTVWNWTEKWVGKGSLKISRDTTTFKSEPASFCVASEGDDLAEGQGSQMIPARPGQKIGLSGFVKSQGEVKVNVAIQAFRANYSPINFQQIRYIQNDTDWTEFNREVELPADTDRFGVVLLIDGKGKAWLDDVKLTVDGVDANTDAIKPPPPDSSFKAPAKGKPDTAAPGFYADYPGAWNQMFLNQLEQTKKGDINIVFIGDSITQGWGGAGEDVFKEKYAPLKAVNFGIGGDSTRQVLYRIENGLLDGLSPKLVVLMIGTNNLYSDFNGGSDAEIAEGIKASVEAIQKKVPSAKVLLVGILPRQNDYFCGRIDKINAEIANLDDSAKVRFLDMKKAFLDSPGKVRAALYVKDQLHLEKPGYQVWSETMQPLFDELLK